MKIYNGIHSPDLLHRRAEQTARIPACVVLSRLPAHCQPVKLKLLLSSHMPITAPSSHSAASEVRHQEIG